MNQLCCDIYKRVFCRLGPIVMARNFLVYLLVLFEFFRMSKACRVHFFSQATQQEMCSTRKFDKKETKILGKLKKCKAHYIDIYLLLLLIYITFTV